MVTLAIAQLGGLVQSSHAQMVTFIWSQAERLRGHFKHHEFGQLLLPFLVLRRLECALAATKSKVLEQSKGLDLDARASDRLLQKASGERFYNISPLDFTRLLSDPDRLSANLLGYVAGFSPGVADVLEAYKFQERLKSLDKAGVLYPVVASFAELDLSQSAVSNEDMGMIFEELIRRFAEISNETAGEHFTPREVIELMVSILFCEDEKALTGVKPVRTLYDPACGTGGMLTISREYLRKLNPEAVLHVYGQELNPETWAIARSDFLIERQDPQQLVQGNSLTDTDGFVSQKFDYMLANPPFGVDWKQYKAEVEREHKALGHAGRYGPGLPRVSDGSLLFLLHMLSKFKDVDDNPATVDIIEGGTRMAIVFSGSPLFSGAAGGGESEIRRYVIENDLLEGIVALPDQLFYNTGISTYFWILTNRKRPENAGKIFLVDARDEFTKMRKSLGEKRKTISEEQIGEITRLYAEATEASEGDKRVKVFSREDFGFQRITVEQPLRRVWRIADGESEEVFTDEKSAKARLKALHPEAETKELNKLLKDAAGSGPDAEISLDKKGNPLPDADLRDQENIPLPSGWLDLSEAARAQALVAQADSYLESDIRPYAPEAWIDHSKTKIGYEIPFTRHFYEYVPPRPLEDIDAELLETEKRIQELLGGLKR